MHSSLRTTGFLLFALGALAQVDTARVSENDFTGHNETIVPNQYIIEVDPDASLSSLRSLITSSNGTVLRTFDTPLFTGLSVSAPALNLDALQNASQVLNAWPMTTIRLFPSSPQRTFADDLAAKNWSVHEYTGVDKAHEAGFFGKGAVVAVVDTGVEYTHEALGGCLGSGCKIAGGHDLVGDGEWPYGPKSPDDDPMDTIGHGTHVAGILAGKSEGYVGVAPEATILSYKVFTSYDLTDEDTLIQAFLLAYDDGADIITASIGGTNGFSSNAWGVIASRLVDAGVVVTIAAGNEGIHGPFFGSNGALGPRVIAVASTEAREMPSDPFDMTFSLDGESNTSTFAYLPSEAGWDVQGLPVVPLAEHAPSNDNACDPLDTAGLPDLSGVIVLIRPGGCYTYIKQQNLEAVGAQYILFYNTAGPFTRVTSWLSFPQLGIIEKAAGEEIISTVAAGGNVTADFSESTGHRKIGVYNSAGGLPSPSTTWGGTFEAGLKPDVAAPGGNIYSTFLSNSWAVLSGTSMATPYVAGIAALWVGRFGGRKDHGPGWARELSDRIVSSGGAVPWHTLAVENEDPVDQGYWAPTIQVGTGQADAWKVLNYTSSLSFESMALNDTRRFSGSHAVRIKNAGRETVEYRFVLQPAGGIHAQSPWYSSFLDNLGEGLDPHDMVPGVSFPSGTFKVSPGEARTAQFNFEPPQNLDVSKMPVYSGKVLIRSSVGEELSVPYMGLGFDLQENTRYALFSETTPFQVGGAGRDDIDIYHSYSFNATWYEQSFPKVYTELKWGCKELRWDIYEANWPENLWSYPPSPGVDGYVGSATYYRYSASYWGFNPDTMDREDTVPFPVRDLTRYSTMAYQQGAFWWMGKLVNGSYIQPGNYTMRFAALIPFGNPENSDDWDVWKTPQIQVRELEI